MTIKFRVNKKKENGNENTVGTYLVFEHIKNLVKSRRNMQNLTLNTFIFKIKNEADLMNGEC